MRKAPSRPVSGRGGVCIFRRWPRVLGRRFCDFSGRLHPACWVGGNAGLGDPLCSIQFVGDA